MTRLRPATSTERGRASILRNRKSLTPDEAAWLERYDAPRRNVGGRVMMLRTKTSPPSEPEPEPTPEPSRQPEPEREELVDVEEDDELDETDTDPDVRDGNASPPATIECDIPDCSACRTMRGAMICKVTGRVTYPRLSDEGSEMFASLGAGAVHLFARTTRRDQYAPRPTPEEKKRLAKGVKMVADRRFPQAGAIDDVLVLMHALYGYGQRAMMEPKPSAVASLPPQQSTPPRAAPPAPAPTPPTPPPAEPGEPTDADFDEQAIRAELERGASAPPAVH